MTNLSSVSSMGKEGTRMKDSERNSSNSSVFYEVLYLGKIKTPHKRVPPTFIDDAFEKFRVHELEKNKERLGLLSESSKENYEPTKEQDGGTARENPATLIDHPLMPLPSAESPVFTENTGSKNDINARFDQRLFQDNLGADVQADNNDFRCRAASASAVSKSSHFRVDKDAMGNKTMLLQIGFSDIRLISPDRRQALFHKHLRDMTYFREGSIHSDHFGFICRDNSSSGLNRYIGYVFRCQSSGVVHDIILGLKTAFQHVQERPHREKNKTCHSCPLFWYHQLAKDVEGAMSNSIIHTILLKKLDEWPEMEKNAILDKLTGAETSDIKEKNEIMMVLLKAHCEVKQKDHVHSYEDPHEIRSDFLNEVGGSLLRAKRSLTNSFTDMMKRKTSVDFSSSSSTYASSTSEQGSSLVSGNGDDVFIRRRSKTVGSSGLDSYEREMAPKSKMSLFIRSTNSGVSPTPPSLSTNASYSPEPEKIEPVLINSSGSRSGTPRVRREIFQRVVTPAKQKSKQSICKRDYKILWKSAIKQQILLIRMERENKKIIASQEEAEERRQKLDYAELVADHNSIWSESCEKMNFRSVTTQMRKGVPKIKRGEIWNYLSNRKDIRVDDSETKPCLDKSYEELKHELTPHQHSILIDLGRTFPEHPHFSKPLGAGQLSLFNVLKAYSLLDPEVGYCQGLSFIASVLIMHTNSEEEAFSLLKHIMFGLGFRKQYMSDMTGLQIHMYQLSRLLHDVQKDVFDHIEEVGVDPSLYATPWFLTIFTANFPLGFAVRVFDMVFLEGLEALFKISLGLVSFAKEAILSCDGLDDMVIFLKSEFSKMSTELLLQVIDHAFSISLSKQLHAYEVEYNVLQDELIGTSPSNPDFEKLQKKVEELAKSLKESEKRIITLESKLNQEKVFSYLPPNKETFSREEVISMFWSILALEPSSSQNT